MGHRCFFIGHRETGKEMAPALRAELRRHIEEYGVMEFVVGHYGGFDFLAREAVAGMKAEYPQITLTLLLPYHPQEHPMMARCTPRDWKTRPGMRPSCGQIAAWWMRRIFSSPASGTLPVLPTISWNMRSGGRSGGSSGSRCSRVRSGPFPTPEKHATMRKTGKNAPRYPWLRNFHGSCMAPQPPFLLYCARGKELTSMKLQEKILYCRKKAGLSQEALAEKLGVSRQAISKWETGESTPEVGKLLLLARAFGVTTDWLLSEEEPVAEAAPVSEPEPEPQPEARPAQEASWLDSLPGVIGRLVKRYGWLLGVREAIGGALFLFMGFLMKAVTGSMGSVMNSAPFGSPFGGFSNSVVWTDEFGNVIDAPISDAELGATLGSEFGYSPFASLVSMTDPMDTMANFVIFLGVVMVVMGVAVAVWLKKKGSMPEDHHMK